MGNNGGNKRGFEKLNYQNLKIQLKTMKSLLKQTEELKIKTSSQEVKAKCQYHIDRLNQGIKETQRIIEEILQHRLDEAHRKDKSHTEVLTR